VVDLQKIYDILTDIAHYTGGGLAGYISFFKPLTSFLFTLVYFAYQFFEHQEIRDDDFIGDLREFIVGFTIGLIIAALLR
jgi:hypothetical protein